MLDEGLTKEKAEERAREKAYSKTFPYNFDLYGNVLHSVATDSRGRF